MKKFLKVTQTALLIAVVGLTNLAHAGGDVQTRDFVINYGSGVNNVEITFSPGYSNRGHTSGLTVTSSSNSTSTTVSVNSGLDNSSTMADNFNRIYLYKWQKLEMDSSKSAPEKLDFWVEGRVTIDGLPLDSRGNEFGFSWAHDAKSGNWWIANNIFVNRNVDNNGLTIGANDGNQIISYCMKADKDSSYSVTISKGACSPTKLNFVFNYDSFTVRNVDFKNYYNPALSSGLLSYESISIQHSTYKTTLTFTSQLNNNNLLADQFNAAYAADHSLNLGGAITDKASSLDFWGEGDLYINYKKVNQVRGIPHAGFSFAHEYSTRNWWIADNGGTAYINPGNYYMLDLVTEDGVAYCLSENKGSNYSVTVLLGRCEVQGLTKHDFYMTGIEFVRYIEYHVSPDNPDPKGLPNFESAVVTRLARNKLRVTVTSVERKSSGLAEDFTALYGSAKSLNLGGLFFTAPNPRHLDFWLSGRLLVTSLDPESSGYDRSAPFELDLGLDPDDDAEIWWIASPEGQRFRYNPEYQVYIWGLSILSSNISLFSAGPNAIGISPTPPHSADFNNFLR